MNVYLPENDVSNFSSEKSKCIFVQADASEFIFEDNSHISVYYCTLADDGHLYVARDRTRMLQNGNGSPIPNGANLDEHSEKKAEKGDGWTLIRDFRSHVLAIITSEGSFDDWSGVNGRGASIMGPDMIAAKDATDALTKVIAGLSAKISTMAANVVHAQSALVEARKEVEAVQEAMSITLRTLGGMELADPQIKVAVYPEDAGPTLVRQEGEHRFRQRLGLALQGMCSLGLHVAESTLTERSRLGIRLRSAETETIYGSWIVPGNGLGGGWLNLDLRAVIGPVYETAILDVSASISHGEMLSVSLGKLEIDPAGSVLASDGGRVGRSLCTRVFIADYGKRNVLPEFWNWDEIGSSSRVVGLPQHVSPACWRTIEVIRGDVELVTVGTGAPRPVARLSSRNDTSLMVPGVNLSGMDLLELGFTVLANSPGGIGVEVVVSSCLPDGTPDQGVRHWSSGCKRLEPHAGTGLVTMSIPPSSGPLTIAVTMRLDDGENEAQCTVEWSSIAGIQLGDRPMARSDAKPRHDPAPEPVRVADAARPSAAAHSVSIVGFDAVKLDHVFVGDDYQHIELYVFELCSGDMIWPEIKFKVAESSGVATIEFRQSGAGGELFETWPSDTADSFGKYFTISESEVNLPQIIKLLTVKEREMLSTLLRVLTRVVLVAFADKRVDEHSRTTWLSCAGRMQNIGYLIRDHVET